ncbi:MAG: hypothetical protein R3C11_10030 [Planctomycetaceae bacterium]
MLARPMFPLVFLCLILIAGCAETSKESGLEANATTQTEATTSNAQNETEKPSAAFTESKVEEPVAQESSFSAELQAVKTAWLENAEQFDKLKAVLNVEYISPPLYKGTLYDPDHEAKLAALKPEDYTIKKWRENLWLSGDKFRREREIVQLPPSEVWLKSQWAYDGHQELNALTFPDRDDVPPQGSKDARSPEEVDHYWPAELEPVYQLSRNADQNIVCDFWDELQVTGQEEYEGESCLNVSVVCKNHETERREYTVSPDKDYHIVKYTHLKNETPFITSEIDYRQVDQDWIPVKWTTIEMKDGDEGPLTVKARQANVTVSEFTSDYVDDNYELFTIFFPPGALVQMWGSSEKIAVASNDPEEAIVANPNEPIDIDSIIDSTLGGNPETSNGTGLPATHKPQEKIVAEYNGKPINLNTFCIDQEGNILLSCGGEIRQLVLSEEEKKLLEEEGEKTEVDTSLNNNQAVIQVYSPERQLIKTIPIPFKATAITPADDGSLLIGGEGRLARLDRDGKILHQGSSPQIDDIDSYREKVQAEVVREQAEMREMIKDDLVVFKEQLAGLEKVKEEDRSRGQERMILALKAQINMFNQLMDTEGEGNSNPQIESMLQMKLRVPAISITEQDLFVTVPSLEGFGFEVWRVDHQFQNPKLVITDLRGCCGQMDVQARGDKVYVAENGRFRVATFSREGEKLNSFGKSDRTSKEGFGSCCNPMNVRCCSNGDILTAESSVGNIKRFSPDGELLANIGHVTVSGGCKNVAIEYDEARDRYFMMDLPNHTVHILYSVAPAEEVTLNTNSSENSN